MCINWEEDQSGVNVLLYNIDTHEQKHKERKGFETPVVYALTNVYPISAVNASH
jgi:hypothetical protein